MNLSKYLARNFVFPALVFFKYDKFLLGKSSKTCCVINFHGVRRSDVGVFNNRHMPVKDFEEVIIYLKKNYNVVSLKEIFEIHRTNKKLNKKTVALTFDDGYLNNFEVALPVLKAQNVPATFYIISKGLSENDFFLWPDAIDLVKKYYKKDIRIKDLLFKAPAFYNDELKLDLLAYLKTCGKETVNLVNDLLKTHPYIRQKMKELSEFTQLVTSKEISHYKGESLLEFGSHTHSHFNLEYLNYNEAEEELKKSKFIIEDKTGKKVISIAFPDGSYSYETLKVSKNEGYENMVVVDYKFNENNQNKNMLSRFTISNSTTPESNAIRLAKQFDKYGFN